MWLSKKKAWLDMCKTPHVYSSDSFLPPPLHVLVPGIQITWWVIGLVCICIYFHDILYLFDNIIPDVASREISIICGFRFLKIKTVLSVAELCYPLGQFSCKTIAHIQGDGLQTSGESFRHILFLGNRDISLDRNTQRWKKDLLFFRKYKIVCCINIFNDLLKNE